MKTLRLLLTAVTTMVATFAWTQTTITLPYNPNADDSPLIQSGDLLTFLSHYGDEFYPAEILINGQSLELYIQQLQEAAANAIGDTVSVQVMIPGTATGQILYWSGTSWQLLDPGEAGHVLQMGTDSIPTWQPGIYEVDGIVGCADPTACNYSANVTLEYPDFCDYLTCAGCTEASAINFDSTATIDDGSCLACSPVTFDGYTYDVIAIGNQCWFAENLRNDNYANGDAIPGNLSDFGWSSANSGAQTVYGEGASFVDDGGSDDEVANLATYGRLYNWYAVDDARGLCPSGWHVPTDGEWMTLEMELGMSSSDANSSGLRGTDQGAQMKSSSSDTPSWNGTNVSGFSALPGGIRSVIGSFLEAEYIGGWWSASPSGASNAWTRALSSEYDYVYRDSFAEFNSGLSVRCVQIYGCTDSSYLEFNPNADMDDGSCATFVIPGCTDTSATNFDSAANEDDGSCIFNIATCAPVTFDGHTYDVVAIGDQCWFAENLRSDNYENGDPILGNLSNSDWVAITLGAQAIYDNDDANLVTYGRLYNWYAVDDSRGLCPSGWHVPTDEEWMTLEMELGMSSSEANSIGWRGTDQGAQMKSSSSDTPSWNGTNASGFSALPGGVRDDGIGSFFNEGDDGYWWSGASFQRSRQLTSGHDDVYRGDMGNPHFGLSVRCVQIYGCTDSSYLEFNPNADMDDGSCVTPAFDGCTDPSYVEFNPQANADDGSCVTSVVYGCTDPSAMNYDSSSTVDISSCIFCNSVIFGGYTYDLVAIGDQCWFAENLRTDNYKNGDPIPGGLSDSDWASTEEGAQTIAGEGSLSEIANLAAFGRLYNWHAVDDPRGVCPEGWRVPTDEEWMTLEMELGMSASEANSSGTRGTNEGAELKSSATDVPYWDGSNSSGFSGVPSGGRADDSGVFQAVGTSGYHWTSTESGATTAWGRNLYTAENHVARYSNYKRNGFAVRCLRVAGCTDASALNYDPSATEDDGSCIYPPCTSVTFDGYSYEVVQIGDQCWFAENLRSDHYRNGDAIPGNLSDSEWESTSSGAQAAYGEGSSTDIEAENLATYGRLYNWYAVDDSRGLCPSGWHIPTDGEWMTLEMELGMSSSEANSSGDRGTDQGAQMKSSSSDTPSWNGTNVSGFSGLPGGFRYRYGNFSYAGDFGYWWSSSPSGSYAWNRSLSYLYDSVYRNDGYHRNGFSVRCVRD